MMKRHLFWVLVLESLLGLHRAVQFQRLQLYWLGRRHEFFGCDSGLLAATCILGEVAKAKSAGITFSQMMSPIVSRYANSGEINFKVDDKDASIARALEVAKTLGAETARSEIDGFRLEYREGWISIRKSNTEPYLRLIVECDSAERLAQWKASLSAAIEGAGR